MVSTSLFDTNDLNVTSPRVISISITDLTPPKIVKQHKFKSIWEKTRQEIRRLNLLGDISSLDYPYNIKISYINNSNKIQKISF